MMVDLLGQLADPVGELQRLAEVLEPVLLLQVMPVDDLPAAAEPLRELAQLATRQRQYATATRYAGLIRQLGHHALSFLALSRATMAASPA